MTKEMQRAFTTRLLLAVVCGCLLVVPFTPNTHAQGKKADKGARGPISKDQLIAHFQDKRVVDGYVIKGNDIIEIIRNTDLDIRIKNSVIEDGLDFGELPKIHLEDVTLPATWSDNENAEWIKRKPFWLEKIPMVTDKIRIIGRGCSMLQTFSSGRVRAMPETKL